MFNTIADPNEKFGRYGIEYHRVTHFTFCSEGETSATRFIFSSELGVGRWEVGRARKATEKSG